MEVKNLIFNALVARLHSQQSEAKAKLAIYLENSVGISEHTNIIEDALTQVRLLSEAESCIRVLSSMLNKEPIKEKE